MIVFIGVWVQPPSAPMRARARPRAPKPLANSSSLSRSARDSVLACAAGRRQPLTMPPGGSTADCSRPTPPPSCASPPRSDRRAAARSAGRACRSRTCPWPRRRCRRWNGRGISTPSTSFQRSTISPSTTFCTSSSATKLISRSIWVNSGWRSRRRSSSRKQRDDLEVAVEARHHEQLLEDLRRLGERVELAGVEARGNQEVARAARRVLHHERRLDLEEAVVGQVRGAWSGRSASGRGSSSAAPAAADPGSGA